MGLSCATLRFSLRKGRHAEHLKLDTMWKVTAERYKLYKSVRVGMGETKYAKEKFRVLVMYFPQRGIWFGRFIRGSKICIGVNKKHSAGVTVGIIWGILRGCD